MQATSLSKLLFPLGLQACPSLCQSWVSDFVWPFLTTLKTIYHKPLSLDLQILGCLSSTASFWDAGKSIKVVFLKNLQNKNLLLLLYYCYYGCYCCYCVCEGAHTPVFVHTPHQRTTSGKPPDFPSTVNSRAELRFAAYIPSTFIH